MPKFQLKTKYRPAGDQPQAIKKLAAGLRTKKRWQTLLGVTGSGKTFTMASLIAKVQRPTLVISHNKTLAAQLFEEFKEFFPQNEVHYFVSYYDYYQPEAYIPQSDTYIEKDAKVNEEIDRLRHAATQALLSRPDTVVVASVSCIYNIGSPQEYQEQSFSIKKGQPIKRQDLLRRLVELQYQRNDVSLENGTFRVLGELVEIWPPTGENVLRLELWGDKIARILVSTKIAPRLKSNVFEKLTPRFRPVREAVIYPAKFWVTEREKLNRSLGDIKNELKEQLEKLRKQKKLLEAERLRRRTMFDLEMIGEVGYCSGIENYSRWFENRVSGQPPFTLLDYLPEDALIFIDESHMSIPQIRGMSAGDRARKQTLVEHGFRLPSALDNRPLKLAEFAHKVKQAIFVSATPGEFEREHSQAVAEQLIRPTGLLDPDIEVRPAKNQLPDLIAEIKKRVAKKQRVLVTTLTKRLAEDLAEYLNDHKIKTSYLHSEIKTLQRPEILLDFRRGKYDVVVGINLLREGLDLPEVSLVAILDADKEGFLRNATTLIQTMGRAARHAEGHVIMYADKITRSMKAAISETQRRRRFQKKYNRQHKITPRGIEKPLKVSTLPASGKKELLQTKAKLRLGDQQFLKEYIKTLRQKLDLANRNLQFQKAIDLETEIAKLKKLVKK